MARSYITKNYATIEYVEQQMKKHEVNPHHVDEVVALFGKHGDEWQTYLKKYAPEYAGK